MDGACRIRGRGSLEKEKKTKAKEGSELQPPWSFNDHCGCIAVPGRTVYQQSAVGTETADVRYKERRSTISRTT